MDPRDSKKNQAPLILHINLKQPQKWTLTRLNECESQLSSMWPLWSFWEVMLVYKYLCARIHTLLKVGYDVSLAYGYLDTGQEES